MPLGENSHRDQSNAFYQILFKDPLHASKWTIAQLVMTHHNESEEAFDALLHYLASKLPFVGQLKESFEAIKQAMIDASPEGTQPSSGLNIDTSFLQSKFQFAAFVMSKLSEKDLIFIKQE